MIEEYKTSQEIMQEIANLKIRLAMQLKFEEEAANALEASKSTDAEQTQRIYHLEKHIHRCVDNKPQFAEPRRTQRHSKPLRVLAVAMMLLVVSMGSALATVEMIQHGILKLDAQVYPEHTEYHLVASGETLNVPEGWTGKFYPAYIPEGFEMENCFYQDVIYFNADKKMLGFSESDENAGLSLDTENAKCSTVRVNGAEATLIEKGEWTAVIWVAHNRMFTVDLDGSAEEVMRIAESIMLIP